MALFKGSSSRAARKGSVEAVFFDVGGTLVYSPLGRLEMLTQALGLIGYNLTRDQVVKANDRARQAVSRRRRRHAKGLESAEASRMWLDHLAAELDLDLRGDLLEGQLAAAVRLVEARPEVVVDPDAHPLLADLKGRGLRLGVISNWSEDLPEYLAERGLAGYFDAIIASDAVGSTKPHREIFLRALSAVNCLPKRAIHVGDDYWADVVGARGIGIRAILVDRRNESPHEDCVTVARLKQVADLV